MQSSFAACVGGSSLGVSDFDHVRFELYSWDAADLLERILCDVCLLQHIWLGGFELFTVCFRRVERVYMHQETIGATAIHFFGSIIFQTNQQFNLFNVSNI